MAYRSVSLGLLTVLMLSACAAKPERNFGVTQPQMTVSVAKPVMLSLESTNWHLASLGGNAPQPTDRAISLLLLQGKVSGFGGCNLFNGRYTFDNERFIFPQLAAASLPCPATAQEKSLFGALQETSFWHIDQATRRLSFFDNNGQKMLEWTVAGQ